MAGRRSRIRAVGGGVLEQRAEQVVAAVEVGQGVAHDEVDAEMPRAGLDDGDRLRVAERVDEEGLPLRAAHPAGHGHRLGGGGGLVQQGRVGQLQAGEVDDHLLVVQERLEPALAHLGLVGRVGRVPARAFQKVAQDHRRGMGAVVAHADQRHRRLVGGRQLGQAVERLRLGQRAGKVERRGRADRGRDRALDQLGQRAQPEFGQHRLDVLRARADVTAHELVSGLKLAQARPGLRHANSPRLDLSVKGGQTTARRIPSSPSPRGRVAG
jgi:hypothetical protein